MKRIITLVFLPLLCSACFKYEGATIVSSIGGTYFSISYDEPLEQQTAILVHAYGDSPAQAVALYIDTMFVDSIACVPYDRLLPIASLYNGIHTLYFVAASDTAVISFTRTGGDNAPTGVLDSGSYAISIVPLPVYRNDSCQLFVANCLRELSYTAYGDFVFAVGAACCMPQQEPFVGDDGDTMAVWLFQLPLFAQHAGRQKVRLFNDEFDTIVTIEVASRYATYDVPLLEPGDSKEHVRALYGIPTSEQRNDTANYYIYNSYPSASGHSIALTVEFDENDRLTGFTLDLADNSSTMHDELVLFMAEHYEYSSSYGQNDLYINAYQLDDATCQIILRRDRNRIIYRFISD